MVHYDGLDGGQPAGDRGLVVLDQARDLPGTSPSPPPSPPPSPRPRLARTSARTSPSPPALLSLEQMKAVEKVLGVDTFVIKGDNKARLRLRQPLLYGHPYHTPPLPPPVRLRSIC